MPGARTCMRALPAPCNRQLVLRMADPLLELPRIGLGLAPPDALQLGLRDLELAARARLVDVVRLDGVVHERQGAILLDLEEARPGRELEHPALAHVDPRRAGLQHRDERGVAREDADLP